MSTQPPNPYTEVTPPPFANQDLLNHSLLFNKTKYIAGKNKNVFIYVGWNLANIIIVNAPDGLVIVDTGEDMKQMKEVWETFQGDSTIDPAIRAKTIAGVFLTHHHADHVNGTNWLVQAGLFGEHGHIWGATNLDSEYQQENGLIMPLMSCRAMAQYNYFLTAYPDEVAGLNSGIGPIISQHIMGYIPPNKLIPLESNTIFKHFIGGLEFQFVYVPSEANSEVAAYLPDENVLLSAEVIQDHTFPNLYTLRGASFRDPSNWSAAIDTFITLFKDAKDMVLQHGPPVLNDYDSNTGSTIKEILVRYRDAIQLVHDQTLRWAMKGYAKEEILHMVKLPPQQVSYKPWLEEFYGTVKHSVPAVYTGYIGWFDGDPIALNPLPRSVFSERLVEAIGGSQRTLERANAAFQQGNILSATNADLALQEWQYAAELATILIREKPLLVQEENPEAAELHKGHSHPHAKKTDDLWWFARYLKAACFRQMAYRQVCANWRGTYLTAAHELEGTCLVSAMTKKMREGAILGAASQSITGNIETLQIRLKSEAAENVNIVIALSVTDAPSTGNLFRLEIRNCILQSTIVTDPTTLTDAALTITGDTKSINLLIGGDVPGGFDALLNGTYPNSQYTYSPSDSVSVSVANSFFSYFEIGRFNSSPNIYVH